MARESPSTSLDDDPPTSPMSKMLPFQDTGGHSYFLLGKSGTPATLNGHEMEEQGLAQRIGHSLNCCSSCDRIVNRENGRTNIKYTGVTSRWFGYITDSFTTLINAPWYGIGLLFGGSYLISWLFFGAMWLIVARYDGHYNGTCLHGVDGFSSALLFSIETQVTIGYGNTFVTNTCTSGLFVLILQCMIGLVLDAVLLGLLFTKITRPRNRRKTILFSRLAVLYEQDGEKYLEFRIGNLRKSQIAECHVRLNLYWYRKKNGSFVFEQHDLHCGYETGTDRVVLLTPASIRHKIDENSPLNGIDLSLMSSEEKLEVVVVLEGVVEATGLTLQALWSYTADEIVVGQKLQSIVSYEKGRWVVDFSKFNSIVPLQSTQVNVQ